MFMTASPGTKSYNYATVKNLHQSMYKLRVVCKHQLKNYVTLSYLVAK